MAAMVDDKKWFANLSRNVYCKAVIAGKIVNNEPDG